jgi:glutamate-1-semialdehyde 2,1-aminomutase
MDTSKSWHWAERMKKVIPWGSSTCSKAPALFPEEPGVIVKGKGCRVWDADGNEYIDYRNGLGPVTLGYCFPDVDRAVAEQLKQGIVFGHPHPLEGEVAELISMVIPCAQKARFLKTGGEAIAACVKIARSYTNREHIVQIGYNGWLNSLSGGANILPGQKAGKAPVGVPKALSELHHTLGWNDVKGVEQLFSAIGDKVAAVVIASTYDTPEEGHAFYPFLRDITKKYGSLLIFDEIVTGFRVSLGGVQEYFNVTPDLAVFAKGIANGMPISVYTGRADIMDVLDKAVVSSTYGGETLSLAAAKAAITVCKRENVPAHLWKQGRRLIDGMHKLFTEHSLSIDIIGYDCCPKLVFQNDLKKPFLKAAYRNGIAFYNNIYINFSHKDKDIDETLERLNKGLKEL